ncbi:MAG: hypothetical protein DA328_01565 [Nitrososphaeraceae archaeon]|nr:hypothetical protein [Nitrososphaeraceae archaeon]
MAGLIALYRHGETLKKSQEQGTIVYLIRAMRLLQHRGKAYWKLIFDQSSIDGTGSLPNDKRIVDIIKKRGISGKLGLGYLSKRPPIYNCMNHIDIIFDGFLVDTEKLYLHPSIGSSKNYDHLYQIYYIFVNFMIKNKNPEYAAEFLDRHLRGNIIMKFGDEIYSYRNSSGFKPLVFASNDEISILSSENLLKTYFPKLNFYDVDMGNLLKISDKNKIEVIAKVEKNPMMMDPFEFIREYHVTSEFNGKSIYSIRRNIGKIQADFLSANVDLDSAYAEPDYTRPMALGFGIQYKKFNPNFEMIEGIIKDRYDDADHMIDFSEQESKNKLLSTGKSLKFVVPKIDTIQNIASIQGTIQTGSTIRETIYYMNNSGISNIDVIVNYVPTIDGRQVGLYTHNREFIASKYVGKVSNLNDLNYNISRELHCNNIYYNSPSMLAKGIGISEKNLWFPEWIRFLDYKK